MPIPRKYLADFEENSIYHVYNRTNNNEEVFPSDENKFFFLRKYKEYLSDYVDTYCWSLLPNHFHLLIRVKSHDRITENINLKAFNDRSQTEKRFLENLCTISQLTEAAFKRFFQSYSLSFNKYRHRKGNLFYKPFKRVLINKESHFTQVVVYIHANAVKHNLTNDFTTYKWSSWNSYLSNNTTQLLREEVIDLVWNQGAVCKST